MSLSVMRKCPVLGCKFNTHPIPADFSQIKKRSPTWLVDSLSNFSRV